MPAIGVPTSHAESGPYLGVVVGNPNAVWRIDTSHPKQYPATRYSQVLFSPVKQQFGGKELEAAETDRLVETDDIDWPGDAYDTDYCDGYEDGFGEGLVEGTLQEIIETSRAFSCPRVLLCDVWLTDSTAHGAWHGSNFISMMRGLPHATRQCKNSVP